MLSQMHKMLKKLPIIDQNLHMWELREARKLIHNFSKP